MSFQPVPEGLRVAVYNAMGGWGPYTVRQIEELFKMYGFTETSPLNDIGGVRRTTVEEFQQQINWADPAQRQRYVMLVDDVLENYPDTDGKPHEVAKKVRRALQLASTQAVAPETTDDLWPVGTVRVFISHLATRREEAHKIAEVLRHVGFACFVAHDQIQPSRSWLREIERALRSCDILLAYVTPGFADSDWTDQEVGWALGRDLVVIPVSVEGAVPTGFLGTYQAVRRYDNQKLAALGREICQAIVDAAFTEQRPAAQTIRDRVADLAVRVFCKVRSEESARFWYGVVMRIPIGAWTSEMRKELDLALSGNEKLQATVLDDPAMPLPEAIRAHLARS